MKIEWLFLAMVSACASLVYISACLYLNLSLALRIFARNGYH
ncbi:hypothetical protein PPEP_a1932 [Pseudoalteromonas peptidolytica F12-50-A1]|uniref:Uncharacterized protein n=1 Tax=Pseudoalteromonas peptidolytica F12-50-A1 TaxID=1315280 RepID=A0A8I0MYG1_9GAMM|nr:hypothetical protein [Pseudoalteromonas peptidolytica F12-50-A1]